ncbi:MAG: gliding motility lipoprotein GldB [Flavobacteriaceae bacterium]|nr:gliding motility lipoprotein GldB [Flavobacteriaceae bacterium]
MYRIVLLFISVVLVVSCVKKEKVVADVSAIDVTVAVKRFEQDFYSAKPSELPELKEKHPHLFPPSVPDSIWVSKIQDPDEQELFREVNTRYVDFRKQSQQLSDLFKHIKYYYPTFKEPTVYTVMSNIDYQNSVIYADSLLFISLDVFLGKDKKVYQDFPDYIKQNFTKDHLIGAVAKRFAEREVPRTNDRTFISRMIQRGKLYYLLDAFLPKVKDTYKIGYTQEQLDWADFNDVEMWKYFVEKQLLFSNDQELNRRFLDNAPFSKFYAAQDNETPGRIGEWFGWQIVRSYMKKNDRTLQEMLQTKNEELFRQSKYKPTK